MEGEENEIFKRSNDAIGTISKSGFRPFLKTALGIVRMPGFGHFPS